MWNFRTDNRSYQSYLAFGFNFNKNWHLKLTLMWGYLCWYLLLLIIFHQCSWYASLHHLWVCKSVCKTWTEKNKFNFNCSFHKFQPQNTVVRYVKAQNIYKNKLIESTHLHQIYSTVIERGILLYFGWEKEDLAGKMEIIVKQIPTPALFLLKKSLWIQ